jgi:uncharacterized membrane protein
MGLTSEIGIGLGTFMLLYIPWRIWHDHQPWKEAVGIYGVIGVSVVLGAYTMYVPDQLLIVVQSILILIGIRNISKYRDRTRHERKKRVDALLHR